MARRPGASKPFSSGRIALHAARLTLVGRAGLQYGNRHFDAQTAVFAHDRFTNDAWINTGKGTG
jgi:hypothetical protein